MSAPRVSVITTVYDRVDCLARCVRAMEHSQFEDFEQIVVSDHPPADVLAQIVDVVAGRTRVRHLNLPARANDWGMTPAWTGVREAAGEYVCFLSDDNAYTPGHLGPLVELLDADRTLGFVYSSCLYAGRKVLNSPPGPARIDLGQPLFRRDVLLARFGKPLPPKQFAWDWVMIATLLHAGVRWRHVPAESFVFRLAEYPHWMKALA